MADVKVTTAPRVLTDKELCDFNTLGAKLLPYWYKCFNKSVSNEKKVYIWKKESLIARDVNDVLVQLQFDDPKGLATQLELAINEWFDLREDEEDDGKVPLSATVKNVACHVRNYLTSREMGTLKSVNPVGTRAKRKASK